MNNSKIKFFRLKALGFYFLKFFIVKNGIF